MRTIMQAAIVSIVTNVQPRATQMEYHCGRLYIHHCSKTDSHRKTSKKPQYTQGVTVTNYRQVQQPTQPHSFIACTYGVHFSEERRHFFT
ncbi:hypothetical protein PHET_04437 [Paragonimus heterotremus]|uniref:Uncharacterized protein n=1 Tax=Paragonimus heterotremus TaxID=100268 RepID=A0A8J4TIG5_9TREM|nr:hypothetical protein PHET_04437 [Paragonimus heterotremus]